MIMIMTLMLMVLLFTMVMVMVIVMMIMKFVLQKGSSPVSQDKEEFCLSLISVKFTTRIAIVYCRMLTLPIEVSCDRAYSETKE